MSASDLDVFIDLRSPYSYVAVAPVRAFAAELDMTLRWHPYAIDIESAYGAVDGRDQRALRKVKYIYRDARRFAGEQGLTIRGPKRIYDVTLAHIGMLYAADAGLLDAYIDAVYERFFTHAIDIEDMAQMIRLMIEIGGSGEAFRDFAQGSGPGRLQREIRNAEALGIFGVPTIAFDGEIYWGSDRLAFLRKQIMQRREPSAGGR